MFSAESSSACRIAPQVPSTIRSILDHSASTSAPLSTASSCMTEAKDLLLPSAPPSASSDRTNPSDFLFRV